MKRTIFFASALVGCVLATEVRVELIPLLVAMSLGAYLFVTGLVSKRPAVKDDTVTVRLPHFDVADVWFVADDGAGAIDSSVAETPAWQQVR